MPTYLLHGFRWRRVSILTLIVRYNLEDAAPDWIAAPATSSTILNTLYTLYDFLPPSERPQASAANISEESVSPEREREKQRASTKESKGSPVNLKDAATQRKSVHLKNGKGTGVEHGKGKNSNGLASGNLRIAETKATPSFNDWSAIKLVEQFDIEDLSTISHPFAYVGDYILEVRTGVSISEEIERYESQLRSQNSALSSTLPTDTPDAQSSNAVDDDLANLATSTKESKSENKSPSWFEKLRDGMEKDAEIGWFIVVCADEDRTFPTPPVEENTEEEEEEEEEEKFSRTDVIKGLFGRRKGDAR